MVAEPSARLAVLDLSDERIVDVHHTRPARVAPQESAYRTPQELYEIISQKDQEMRTAHEAWEGDQGGTYILYQSYRIFQRISTKKTQQIRQRPQ